MLQNLQYSFFTVQNQGRYGQIHPWHVLYTDCSHYLAFDRNDVGFTCVYNAHCSWRYHSLISKLSRHHRFCNRRKRSFSYSAPRNRSDSSRMGRISIDGYISSQSSSLIFRMRNIFRNIFHDHKIHHEKKQSVPIVKSKFHRNFSAIKFLPIFAALTISILGVFIIVSEVPLLGVKNFPVWADLLIFIGLFVISAPSNFPIFF